jgi:hypothetical protein
VNEQLVCVWQTVLDVNTLFKKRIVFAIICKKSSISFMKQDAVRFIVLASEVSILNPILNA